MHTKIGAADGSTTNGARRGVDTDLPGGGPDPRRRSKWIAIALVSVLFITASGVTSYLIRSAQVNAAQAALDARTAAVQASASASAAAVEAARQRTIEQETAAAVTAVNAAFDQLKAAKNTAEIRAAAQAAVAKGAEIKQGMVANPNLKPSVEALEAFGSLSQLSGDSLDTWPTARNRLYDAADGVGTAGLAVDASSSLIAVDGLVGTARKSLSDYAMAVAVAKERHDQATAELNAYVEATELQITKYNNLRNDTSDWMRRAGAVNPVSLAESRRFFETGVTARRNVRDALAAQRVPDALTSEHDGLVSVVALGAVVVDSFALTLNDKATCTIASCNLTTTAGYEAFDKASQAISEKYDDEVLPDWEDAVQEQRDQIESWLEVPQPVV